MFLLKITEECTAESIFSHFLYAFYMHMDMYVAYCVYNVQMLWTGKHTSRLPVIFYQPK